MANDAGHGGAKVTVAYTNQPCRRKLQFINGKFAVQKPQTTTVQRRNERERNRVKLINRTFSTLRDSLPPAYHGRKERKLSKVEVLKTATSYIANLMQLLQDDDIKQRQRQQPQQQQQQCYAYSSLQQQQQQQQQQDYQPIDLLPDFLETDDEDEDELQQQQQQQQQQQASSSCDAGSTESDSSSPLHHVHMQYCNQQQHQLMQQQQQQQQQQQLVMQQQTQYSPCLLQYQQQQQQQPQLLVTPELIALDFSTPIKPQHQQQQAETSLDHLQATVSSVVVEEAGHHFPVLSITESLHPSGCYPTLS